MKERKEIIASLTLAFDALIETALAMQYATTPEGRALYARVLRALDAVGDVPKSLQKDWEDFREHEDEWGEAA